MVEEERGEPAQLAEAELRGGDGAGVELAGELADGEPFELRVSIPDDERVTIELDDQPAAPRRCGLGASWEGRAGERLTGLGARHSEGFDQRGRRVRLGADRRYTGPDCPPDMLETGGIPQGDCAPAPWLLSSAGWALWAETWGAGLELDLSERLSVSQRSEAGPLRLHLLTDPTPAARLRHYLRLTGLPALLPEWAYGHWKSRDVYGHEREVLEDLEGYVEHALPLDAIVIDSPWESQYNTWLFNPFQFPDPERLVGRLREAGVRTVVWVTPWVNLDSADGQRPGDPGRSACTPDPRRTTPRAPGRGHFVRGADGRPWVGRWWMGSGSLVDFTSPAARRWWRRQARTVLELGIEGIKADDGEGYYLPPDARFADGRCGAEAAWQYGELYRRTMQRALDDVHPPDRRPVRPLGVGRPAGNRDHLGRRSGLRLLVPAGAGGRNADRGGERLLQLVARRRGLPRPPSGGALPPRAAAALGAVRLLHPADARPRSLRAGSLALRRKDAWLLPRLPAAPRAAGSLHPRRGSDRRPLRAADHPGRCASSIPRTRAAGRSTTPTCSGHRYGWPRFSSRAPPSAASTSRVASGSTTGPGRR